MAKCASTESPSGCRRRSTPGRTYSSGRKTANTPRPTPTIGSSKSPPASSSTRSKRPGRLLFRLENFHQFLHRIGALFKLCLFLIGQLDLVDLLDPECAEFHRHADEQSVDAILAF